MNKAQSSSHTLAADITRTASKQTYYTIRFLVDRERIPDAYRAYGYFRSLDDVLDAPGGSQAEKIAFANRQAALLESCYRGEVPEVLSPEEHMLVDLIQNNGSADSGLASYLRNMMAVMQFDAGRRGNLISQAELDAYTTSLATAVTDALHHFIAHDTPPPSNGARYLAVTAAHITHMLRDAHEDIEGGYFNTPTEYIKARSICPQETGSLAYQAWVCQRVRTAKRYFRAGREYISQVKSLRCRIAGFAYAARFEWMLRTIVRENYCLRADYPERKSLRAGLWMAWKTLASALFIPCLKPGIPVMAVDPTHKPNFSENL
jgi:phytoene/squalene synthetase